ncbi:MAG: SH3 domain-containing protein [Anaerolineae bacterium]|nr:SH3 domain-containing protein [Anaerolineae bacterium]
MRKFSRRFILLIILGLFLAVTACATSGKPAAQSDRPVVTISAPGEGSRFTVGQAVTLEFGATDAVGVAQVEVTINGKPVYVEVVNPPVNAFVASYVWTPERDGSYVIQAVAFSLDGDSSEPVQVVVEVGDTGSEILPTPVPVELLPTAVPDTPTSPPATSIPIPTPTPGSTGDQVKLKPIVTALIALNVRSGPGTAYPVIGRLAQNQSAEIVGRDELGYWWQIVYPSAQGEVGWVAAGGEFSSAINTGGVPVAEIPPEPSAPATETAPSDLGTDNFKPTIYSFTADRYIIAPGESVTLNWDLANAKTAYLRHNGVEEGVVAPGSKTIAPTSDTTYTLIARNDAGETTAQLSIQVAGPTPTTVPVLRSGRNRIVHGQSIDFDQGVVQDTIGSDVDFYWDGQKKQFIPQRGATGALLSSSYGDITLDRCLTASYGQPINTGNGTALMTGCYKTSQGRYGKFYVAEWDLAGNLTVEWLTWDYR